MLIDCHTHLESFADDEVGDVLDRARRAGVGLVLSAGTTLRSSRRAVDLSGAFTDVFAGVGIHPMDLTGPVDEDSYRQLQALATSTDKVLVVSEIGLDFADGSPDRAMQYQAFREQIRLARELSLPIVFHSRAAHRETLRVLREERAYEVGGAMHYFQGDLKTAGQAVDLGFKISLARPLLRLPDLQKVAAALPIEHIVLETDAAPQPFKSKRSNWTESRHLVDIAEKLAELKGISFEEVESTTSKNAVVLLGSEAVHRHLGLATPR